MVCCGGKLGKELINSEGWRGPVCARMALSDVFDANSATLLLYLYCGWLLQLDCDAEFARRQRIGNIARYWNMEIYSLLPKCPADISDLGPRAAYNASFVRISDIIAAKNWDTECGNATMHTMHTN